MPKLEFYLSQIVKYGLYAILLAPLAFWPRALFPFLTPKFILFQVLVEIVFAAWLILLFKRGFTRIWADLRKNYIVFALVLLIIISFISAFFGVDFHRSFWGIGARMTGLWAELHFLMWFVVLMSFSLKSDFNWQKYLNFSFGVALVVAASAFYQNSKWALQLGYGVFNNPTFVAPYLIFHFFWGLYQTLASSLRNPNLQIHSNSTNNIRSIRMSFVDLNHYKNWVFGAGTVFLFAMILFVQIRGAVLGLLVGLFIFGIGLIFTNILSRRARILFSVFYFLLSISLVSLWFSRGNEAIQKISPIKRVTGISLRETTVQTRILAWQVALKGFKDQTLFGTGPENFNYLFNKHYDPKFLKFGGGGFGETWFDKPHNAFLEILTEKGITGAAAYIFLWLMATLSLFRLWKSDEKFLSLFLVSAFTAYLGSIFFSFDSFGSWFGLYLMLGFLASHSDSNLQIYSNFTNINQNIKKLFVVFACISILGLLGVNLSIWRANVADADALRIFPRDPEKGIELFKKSFGYFTPYKAEYQFDLVSSVAGAVSKNLSLPDLENTLNFALESADKALAAHPKNAAYYTDMTKIYGILGEKGRDVGILSQGELLGEKSLELSPNRQETLFYLTRIALLKNDTKSALKWAKQAVDAEPSIRQSHWYLGLAYIANSQIQEGTNEIKKALDLGYVPQNEKEKNIIKNLGL